MYFSVTNPVVCMYFQGMRTAKAGILGTSISKKSQRNLKEKILYMKTSHILEEQMIKRRPSTKRQILTEHSITKIQYTFTLLSKPHPPRMWWALTRLYEKNRTHYQLAGRPHPYSGFERGLVLLQTPLGSS